MVDDLRNFYYFMAIKNYNFVIILDKPWCMHFVRYIFLKQSYALKNLYRLFSVS